MVPPEQVAQFRELLLELSAGKGLLGKLAQLQAADEAQNEAVEEVPTTTARERMQREFDQGRQRIANSIRQRAGELDRPQQHQLQMELEGNLRVQLEREYQRSFPTMAPEEDTEKKKNVLSHLYSLTGDVKIPLVVDLLSRWLQDPTKGKVCIFAHHISMLDAIEQGCNLGDKFIRIDGSTSAKHRQEQIGQFQSDPSVRVALLGITAAGVAVTLTASSTVIFAELFWTPALMIQAEDRCHRIGQYVVVVWWCVAVLELNVVLLLLLLFVYQIGSCQLLVCGGQGNIG